MSFVLSQEDKDLLSALKGDFNARRRLNRIPQRRRRTPPAGKGSSTTSNVEINLVLIYKDIPAAEAIDDTVLTDLDIPLDYDEEGFSIEFEDPDGHTLEQLELYGYQREQIYLPVYRQIIASDEWFYDIDDGKEGWLLDYTITTEAEYMRKIVRYKTIPVWTDDGKAFTVGEYKRSDYPDYPENEEFPPEGLPTNFLKKKYRGIVINNVLITILCKLLPAPELPSTPLSS